MVHYIINFCFILLIIIIILIIIYIILYKNVAGNIEQVLAATPHKAPTIRSPTTYHENYTS